MSGGRPDPEHRIAVFTFHRALNCGAVLQAWALQEILRRLGLEPEFPDCTRVGSYRLFGKVWYRRNPGRSPVRWLYQELSAIVPELRKRLRFFSFRRRYLSVRAMLSTEIATRYAAVIVGSDQVWNDAITREEDGYFLTTVFADDAFRRYSYAVSLGDCRPSDARLGVLAAAARRFENLSVREESPPLADAHGRLPFVDPDPTLLLDPEDYAEVAYPKPLVRRPYLLVYTLVHVAETLKAAARLARRLDLELVVVHMYQYGRTRAAGGASPKIDVSPDRFLAYFRDAAAVVTSTFHGAAFALIYRKPFAVLPGYDGRVPRRIAALLGPLDEGGRIVADASDDARSVLALSSAPRLETDGKLKTVRSVAIERLRRILSEGQEVARK